MEAVLDHPVIAFTSAVEQQKSKASSLICVVWSTKKLSFDVYPQRNPVRLVLLSNRGSPDNAGSLGFDEELNALPVSYKIPSIVAPSRQKQRGFLKFPGLVTSWGSLFVVPPRLVIDACSSYSSIDKWDSQLVTFQYTCLFHSCCKPLVKDCIGTVCSVGVRLIRFFMLLFLCFCLFKRFI